MTMLLHFSSFNLKENSQILKKLNQLNYSL